jgi:hypothetical protein
MYCRLVVIHDHNGSGCAHTHDATSVIYHGEMDVEAKLLAVMSAVTCQVNRQYDGTSEKV